MALASFAFTGCGQGGEGAAPGGDGVIRLTIGAGHTAALVYVRAAEDFFMPEVARRVAEETNYTIEWTPAWASVAGLNEVLGATEAGLLDIGLVWSAFEPSILWLHNLHAYTPFHSPDSEQVVRLMNKLYDEFPYFKQIFEDNGQRWLASASSGNFQLITTTPISSVDQVSGKTIGAAGPNLSLLRGTGAIPFPGMLPEVYMNFQTGMIDGYIMYATSNMNFMLYEVAPYLSMMDIGAVALAKMTINTGVWNSLPPEVQAIIEEVAQEYSVVSPRMSMESDREALRIMQERGLTLVEFTPAERARWAALMPNVAMEWVEEAESMGYPGRAILERYMELLEAEGVVLPRDWSVD